MYKQVVALLTVIAAFFFTVFGHGEAFADQAKAAGKNMKATGNNPKAAFKMIDFVTTQDGSPLVIKAELFDTPQAREFAMTGKNPYIGQQGAIDRGKQMFEMYSCTQCHGGDAQGWTGPSLWAEKLRIYKDSTNKGMFETIWHGTNGGMGAKGKGLMDPDDPKYGLMPDDVLQVIAWIRTHGNITGNE